MIIDDFFNKLKINEDNPQTATEEQIERLKNKLISFPDMLEKRPIVYDSSDDYKILGGNKRYTVIKRLIEENESYEETFLKPEYFADCSKWTKEQKDQFVITDNISDGNWDFDVLVNKWSEQPLAEWGLDMEGWINPKPEKAKNKEIDSNELAKELNTTCPRCGFEFKGKEGIEQASDE